MLEVVFVLTGGTGRETEISGERETKLRTTSRSRLAETVVPGELQLIL